jgi:hypothetical protein
MRHLVIVLLGLGVIAGYGSALHGLHSGHDRGSSWSCHGEK